MGIAGCRAIRILNIVFAAVTGCIKVGTPFFHIATHIVYAELVFFLPAYRVHMVF